MSSTIHQILESMGIKITQHEMPNTVPENSPSLCVLIYGTSDLELQGVDIVTSLLIRQGLCHTFVLELMSGSHMLLYIPKDEVNEQPSEQRLFGSLKKKDETDTKPVVVMLMTVHSQLSRNQFDTEA